MLHYTLCSVLFILNIRSGTLWRISSIIICFIPCLTKVVVVSITTSRVGIGMANGRTSRFWSADSWSRASSGMKVMPCPGS
ncbi:MAG: hypothetical protein PUD94_09870 [Prevotellaceae bacterium]|nr:hypothetical protein [Prevotellaceae bacterium]MDD5993043.1 hypothetical protein [Prevotellaceae bacterium]MDD6008963.1 hypothetical protein [Prevotellaceae bacterium]MDD6112416.1 hypothetical protein [Prevotellaceae bacterium]MDD6781294.1 hypothetical protein [Prevotellaceae bacterium]